jgi:bridging integrator 3
LQSRKALVAAKAEFDNQNSLLAEELPRLYESRIEYFQPSLQALIHAQVIALPDV